jgi:hypothetical protein
VPTVAIIDGVKIQFYAQEHPPPHFHAIFAEHRAQIEIETLRVLKAASPARNSRACYLGRRRGPMH